MICLNCNKRKAIKQNIVGYTYCKVCINKQRQYGSLGETIEMTTPEIKEERKQYQSEILQPFRSGQVSKEYIKAYGAKGIEATPQEIKNAKNVWNHGYYKEE